MKDHATRAAVSIANYCAGRFPTDPPPDEMLDVPWFAEKVRAAIDAATADLRAELRSETRMYETVVNLHERVRKAVLDAMGEVGLFLPEKR